jgi:O-antigen/teichoic acid export membrane protein
VWALVFPALPLFIGQIYLFTRVSGLALKPSLPRSSRSYFGSATKLWLAGASDVALLRADKFFLGRLSGMAQLGDYNRAFNFSPVAARALNSFLAGPTISALTRTTQADDRLRLILKSAILLGAAGLGNFVVWRFFSKPLVPWIFGEQWINAIPVFEAMAPLSLCMAAAYLPTAVAIALRAYGELAVVRIVSLVGFLSATLLLHAQISAVLMAWLLQATLVAQGLLLFLILWPRYLRTRTIQAESQVSAGDHLQAPNDGSQ